MRLILLLAVSQGITAILTAQVAMDTVRLSEFEVSAQYSNLPSSFFKWSFDSTAISNSPYDELSDFFSDNTAIHMKNYGVDGISSISMRGTSASHTKVFWNGIALNSPMLGQADASLFPVAFIDQLELHPGTGSVFEGSGGLGGNVVLWNKRNSDNKDHLMVSAAAGSFGTYGQSAKAIINQGKWQFKTTLLNRIAQNDFSYVDYRLNNRRLKRQNASSLSRSAMQEAYFKINSRNEISAKIWYVQKERDIPAIMGLENNAENQRDESIKAVLGWENRTDRMLSTVNLGVIRDELIYKDAELGINDLSQVISGQLVANNQYFLSEKVKFKSQLRLSSDQAKSDGYDGRKGRQSISFLTGITWKVDKDRITLDAYSRQEQWNNSKTYVLPAVGISYAIGKNRQWVGRANTAANINYPTLNDQYWINSGNPDLKAEESKGFEFGISNKQINLSKSTRMEADINFYNNQIKNWILWTPSMGLWEPRNVRSVNNQGVELMLHPKTLIGKTELGLSLNYSLNSSRDVSRNQELNENYNKQLIYVPRNKYSTVASCTRGKYKLWSRNTFTDKVYTTPSNDTYLPSFFISDAGISRNFKLKTTQTSLQFIVENLFAENYQLVADRPMPGRNFSVNLTIQL